jgi:hypothetical protein
VATNQRFHKHLNWPRIMPDLEQLASESPRSVPVPDRDRFDPRPWIEAYQAGVGSPLEHAFLRLFEKHGLDVQQQLPIGPDNGSRPISVADFVVKGTSIAIYVDGAAFHTGTNLRRDRAIRSKLGQGSAAWVIVELGQGDLKQPEGVLARIEAARAKGATHGPG